MPGGIETKHHIWCIIYDVTDTDNASLIVRDFDD
jgi:hypothetical protein